MIRDLDLHPEPHSLSANVCIVGAGIAGLLIADSLSRKGVRTVVLESGGQEQAAETHPLNRVVLKGARYDGAEHGRFRCLGGTSTRWGGAMIPFLAGDLEPRESMDLPEWPVRMADIAGYQSEIESLFRLCGGGFDAEFLPDDEQEEFFSSSDDPGIAPRFAKWPAFRNRNIATLLSDRIEADSGPEVWLNATVTDFGLDREKGRVSDIIAQNNRGQTIRVVAPNFVLCAGAIESTRLLLMLDRQNDNRPFEACKALGRYFHDHLSAPMARIQARAPITLNRLAGYRFVGQTMRNLRLEYTPEAQREDGALSGFAHMACRADGASGFDAVRDLLRGYQQHGRIEGRLIGRILADTPYLARAAWWRYARNQLYWPRRAHHELHIVTEQAPRAENRITLTDERDPFGKPVAALDWSVDDRDLPTFSAMMRRLETFWQQNGLERIGTLDWISSPERLSVHHISEDGGGGIFHPGGSTRMGHTPSDSVLDANLACHAVPNLHVAATSAFPTGASANPTMTLMMFALRLADHLAK